MVWRRLGYCTTRVGCNETSQRLWGLSVLVTPGLVTSEAFAEAIITDDDRALATSPVSVILAGGVEAYPVHSVELHTLASAAQAGWSPCPGDGDRVVFVRFEQGSTTPTHVRSTL